MKKNNLLTSIEAVPLFINVLFSLLFFFLLFIAYEILLDIVLHETWFNIIFVNSILVVFFFFSGLNLVVMVIKIKRILLRIKEINTINEVKSFVFSFFEDNFHPYFPTKNLTIRQIIGYVSLIGYIYVNFWAAVDDWHMLLTWRFWITSIVVYYYIMNYLLKEKPKL